MQMVKAKYLTALTYLKTRITIKNTCDTMVAVKTVFVDIWPDISNNQHTMDK